MLYLLLHSEANGGKDFSDRPEGRMQIGRKSLSTLLVHYIRLDLVDRGVEVILTPLLKPLGGVSQGQSAL